MSAPKPGERPGTDERKRLSSTIGLCARARKLLIGTPMITDTLHRKGKSGVAAVLEASDTSANTHARLASKCAYYGVTLFRLPLTVDELARTVGKIRPVASVGVTDEGMLRSLAPLLSAVCPPDPPPSAEEPDTVRH